MIRRNLIAVVAACGALAVGIALGGGPLSDLGHAEPEPSSAPSQAPADVRAQATRGEDFAEAVAPGLLAGRLSGQRITVWAMPGADPATVTALEDRVKAAGGVVGESVELRAAAVDPGRKTFADTLGRQLAKQFGSRVDSGLATYERLGQVIGATYAAHVRVGSSTAEQVTASKTLVAGKLVKTGHDDGPGTLAVLVLGDHVDETVLTGFVSGLSRAVNGLVVTGDTASAGGDLAVLRHEKSQPAFGTVDGSDTTIGRVATVLALARQTHQRGGSFGAPGFGGIANSG
ncbi:copper transporter [Nocardioides sp. DS6]|uniref:Copper transporter n=1 Tax=Nocardioides eburneus TaxID=3231482 RepID=A0ABV3T3B1_9ACTN